ncbi:hypothetical protein B0H13DRAFT_2518653, partial [Mycena leptocephala]
VGQPQPNNAANQRPQYASPTCFYHPKSRFFLHLYMSQINIDGKISYFQLFALILSHLFPLATMKTEDIDESTPGGVEETVKSIQEDAPKDTIRLVSGDNVSISRIRRKVMVLLSEVPAFNLNQVVQDMHTEGMEAQLKFVVDTQLEGAKGENRILPWILRVDRVDIDKWKSRRMSIQKGLRGNAHQAPPSFTDLLSPSDMLSAKEFRLGGDHPVQRDPLPCNKLGVQPANQPSLALSISSSHPLTRHRHNYLRTASIHRLLFNIRHRPLREPILDVQILQTPHTLNLLTREVLRVVQELLEHRLVEFAVREPGPGDVGWARVGACRAVERGAGARPVGARAELRDDVLHVCEQIRVGARAGTPGVSNSGRSPI